MEGRSRVVSKDISDAVDWIMPSMLRVFIASDNVVRFDPVGPEDQQAAEQETDYVNHVIMKENQGFLIFHDWFKDALLLRNGYVKHWWEEEEKVSQETYTNLTEEEAALLIQEKEQYGTVDIVGQETKQTEMGVTYDLKIKCTNKSGRVEIEPIPPEEILVSNRTRGSLRNSAFVQHVTRKTRSDLIEMGLDKEWVDSLPNWTESDKDQQKIARDNTTDESYMSDAMDRATQEIEYKETFVRVDADEDGISELRRIVVVGGNLPEGEKWNMEIDSIPVSYLTPNRMPHRHVGISVYDELKDLAEIKTALVRGTLDNTYQLINSEWAVNERVHLQDFLQSRPNGVKRIMGKEPIGDAATQIIKQPIIQHVIPVLDYLDSIKESRTGVGQSVMGLDADTLKKTTEGAARMALQQANSKVEMIARVFAETGVKDLALAVHELLLKHQDKPKIVKIKNEWVPVNPQEWKQRTDLTVSVGLGTGTQDEIRANLLMLADLQERAAQAGIVLPKNVYNLANKSANALGFKQEGEFFTDPDSEEFKQMQAQQSQGQANPLAEAEQIKGQFKLQSEQIKRDMDTMRDSQKQAFEQYKFDKEHSLNIAVEEIKALIAGLKAVDLGQPGIGTETMQPQAAQPEPTQPEQAEPAINPEVVQAILQRQEEMAQMMQSMMQTKNQPKNVVFRKGEDGRIAGATIQ